MSTCKYKYNGREYTESKLKDSYSKSLQEGLGWLGDVLPNTQLELVDGMVDNIGKGSYNTVTDLIRLSKDYADKGTVKHEAVHKVLNMLPNTEKEKILNAGSKKYGIKRGNSKAKIKYSKAQQNQINYTLKAVDILQSDKAEQVFAKGKKNNWDLNKILTVLQVPKDQKQIILNSEFESGYVSELGLRENIIMSLLAENSFAVEVNTAETDIVRETPYDFNLNGDSYSMSYFQGIEEDFTYYYKNNKEISYEEHQKAMKDVNSIKIPTQHYSSLSAPGNTKRKNGKYAENPDWEYQELAIQTPDIINNNSNHISDFSNGVSNMLGWIRVWYNKKTGAVEVQEVQSALFQEGRDKNDLISEPDIKMNDEGEEYSEIQNLKNLIARYKEGIAQEEISEEDAKIEIDKLNKKINKKLNERSNNRESVSNKFLQLLNKKNNWVTVFVKSIIQDSTKKGYEKVLFPKGDTSVKIESADKVNSIAEAKEKNLKTLASTGEFYEDTVSNILNKRFGKETVKEITDEYGNKWNEVDLSNAKVKEQTNNILFQSPKLEYTGDLAIEERIAKEAETSKDRPKGIIEEFIQRIKDFLNDLFKSKDEISKLLRNLNKKKYANFQILPDITITNEQLNKDCNG